MATARSANNSRLGYESASMNTSQSPVAAEAPLLRAREIWFIASNTTVASAARAFSAVRSVELLSQTMISLCQPSEEKASVAALILRRERAMNFSSLNAGTMIEIFTRAFGNARPHKCQKPTGTEARPTHCGACTAAAHGRVQRCLAVRPFDRSESAALRSNS